MYFERSQKKWEKIFHPENNIKIKFLVVLLTKLFVVKIDLAKMLFFTEEKVLLTDLLKQFLRSMIIVKK